MRFRSTEENSKAELHEVKADDQSEVSAVLTVRKQIKSHTRIGILTFSVFSEFVP